MKKNYNFVRVLLLLLCIGTLKISAQLSGVVTINSGAATGGTNYQTFAAFATALNANGISGPLTVNVIASTGPYVEQVAFNAITGVSATNTITINGNGNLLTFAATASAPHTMLLNGTDYLYVNNLQMQGTGTSYAMVCILTNNANNNNFAACSFSCPANGTSSYQIPFAISGSATFPTSGGTANNNTITGCNLFSGYYAVFHYGLTSSPYTSGNKFINCTIKDWYYYAMYTYYAKDLVFKGCLFERPTRTTLTTQYFCYGWYMQGFLFEGNTVTNLYGGNLAYTGTMYGFYYAGYYSPNPANRNIWRNNVFRETRNSGSNYWFYYNYYGGNDYYHNTFSFDSQTATNNNNYVFYYCYDYNGSYNTFKNNSFSFTGTGTGSEYAYYFTSSYAMSAVNYNNYYLNSTNSYIGFYTSAANNLAAWQSQGADANSVALNPQYTNWAAGNLQPTNAALNNLGTALNLPTDINNNPRSQTTPDIGAYEFLSANCTGVPTASTINSPTYALCPGETANLVLNGFTSDLGVVYQWLSSTTSSVGPWTLISGANSVVYTTPGIFATTYYGVAMTCTNSVGSNTATTILNVAGTTTSTVPYYENFEGISGSNKLPNCSWSSNSLGGNCQTYTSTLNQNRSANSGSKYAAFYGYYITGTNYFYTNAMQLNAGVTYSASMFYKTEYYGYTNFTDLSILVGPNQSTTGLVQVATTNGPASSLIYKSLSNTFTVATSGLYYVAVAATSSGNYGAYYMSWDDLRIDVPCEINSPTVSLSANSQTICNGETVNITAAGGDDYLWNTGDTGPTFTATPNNNATYYVVATSSLSGCSVTLASNVVVLESPSIIAHASEPVICAGQSANITAIGATTYTWSNAGTSQVITVTPNTTTSYTVLGSNANGCQSSAVALITVNPNPTVSATTNAPDPNQICPGEQITLTGNGASTYVWAASSIYITGSQVVVSPMITTVYSVTGTNAAGCSATTLLTLNVGECTGITKLTANSSAFEVFPNPTNSEITIKTFNSETKSFELTDLSGRVVFTGKGSDESAQINMRSFANGVYYLKIQSAASTDVIKIIKN